MPVTLEGARAERVRLGPSLKIHASPGTDERVSNRLAPYVPPLILSNPEHAAPQPTMRTMTEGEIDSFVSTQGFGVLALAEGNHAYGAPLFYGAREGAIYFQTRAGEKTRYLYATTEACLTISSTRALEDWASVQLIGRLERVDALSSLSVAGSAIVGVPPPLLWADDDERANESRAPGVTTFRLVPTKRVGRYSQPPKLEGKERYVGF